ncbi:MAG: bifunctional 5,10-methylenetetrahydrofolate dehydrogenase/5,10-methenyltetrahydrofolate cyclohydrolase [Chloroflexota bacterium]|nr:bifunctional 5,10-methylenetetrahydrofolate dehydrogenase/5,10-methenyltetrahydrofolate cyclohydrolase [Chloroflexota bacterium]
MNPKEVAPLAAGVATGVETHREGGARLLEGAPIATAIRGRLIGEADSFLDRHGFRPTLAVVLIGADAPSAVYLSQIVRTCERTGIIGRVVDIGPRVTATVIRRRIDELNRDPLVSGIIVQMPLPQRIPLRAVIEAIDPRKDIDGLHPSNAGLLAQGYDGFLPATAQATVEILKRSGYRLEGLDATVIGRSNVVGRPASLLLQREHCTVTTCHRRTRDLAAHVGRADLVVVAAGSPGLVTGAMLKPGALVVDVGINVVGDRIVGDVDFGSALPVARAITPVPGGVGPLTNAILLEHLMAAAHAQHDDGAR